jgi:hypothetical protein
MKQLSSRTAGAQGAHIGTLIRARTLSLPVSDLGGKNLPYDLTMRFYRQVQLDCSNASEAAHAAASLCGTEA